MKTWWFIGILFLQKLSFSQDSCLPQYRLPVQHVQVNSVNIAYVEKGKGKPILFIHGLGGNLSHWLKSVESLSKKYRCIALDLPGYGRSDKQFTPQGVDQLQYYSDILKGFIDRKKLKDVVLAGHSMGAQIAIIAGLQYPRQIAKLVLVAPAGLETFTEAEAKLLISATPPAVFARQDETAIRASFKQNFQQLPADAETLIRDRLRMKECADFAYYTETISKNIQGMLEHPVKGELVNIGQPVLIIFGAADALIPNKLLHQKLTREDLTKEATALIPNGKVVIVPGGHMVQYEQPAEVNKSILSFLK